MITMTGTGQIADPLERCRPRILIQMLGGPADGESKWIDAGATRYAVQDAKPLSPPALDRDPDPRCVVTTHVYVIDDRAKPGGAYLAYLDPIDPRAVAAQDALPLLTSAMQRALLTRDGQGDYSSRTFDALLKAGLVDDMFDFTDLGIDVAAELRRSR